MSAADIVAFAACLAAGYGVGSIPVTAWIARAAGVNPHLDGERNTGPAGVWTVAGPGWGLLAFSAELSKGLLPVALATVTWSWGAGWAAGLGALLGDCWPAIGRLPGGRGVGVLPGVAFALAPPAGVIGVLLALTAAGAARLLGRDGRVLAIAVCIGTYSLAFYAAYQDPLRVAALMALYVVAGIRLVSTRSEPRRQRQPR